MNQQPIYIDRPPRIQPELPIDEIEIPGPPEKQEEGFARLVQVGLPLLMIIGYVLVGTLGGVGRNPWFLLPMALSVVASVVFSVYSIRQEKQKQAEIEKAYDDRLVELNKDMEEYHNRQRLFYRYNYPDRLTTFRIVHNARLEAEKAKGALRAETRVWERRSADDDFGVVRLGMGTLPSTVLYTLGDAENFEDRQVREAMKLEEDSRFVSDIPVIISLRQPYEERGNEEGEDETEEEEEAKEALALHTPVSHALGIAGDKAVVYKFTWAMLAHYVVFHAQMDARLYVLGSSSKPGWAWTDNLPHSQGEEQQQFRCFVQEIKEEKKENSFGEDDEGELGQFLEGLRKVLAQRKIQLQERGDNEGPGDPTLPFLLVVVDLMDAIYDKESPLSLSYLESDAAMTILLEEGNKLGAAVVFLVPERSKVPSGCQSIIEIEKTTPATNSKVEQEQQKLHFRYAEVDVNSFRYIGEADYIAKPEEMSILAQQLAQLKIRESFGANLTRTVLFLDLMDYKSLQDLKEKTWTSWGLSTEAENANWLRVKIGMMSGNKPRALAFSAKKDGVHGMVAGSTGSGKSELLISLITGMAVTYAPSVLNFVLVDYKGGGAFKEFEALPHCVDIITNLEGDAVTRMFTAITSEMQRRQALNAETGTKNIVDYRQKGLHETHGPYPYLFIIIDEFAEMIADRSEYKTELESITRVGRAQGVSLILAAQRPSGVTDQMRSNIKFRICLRVETPPESREMLRRSDAAYLPGDIPGRGYLQVGNDEIELIQSAYTGEKYIDPSQAQVKVIWPNRGTYDPAQDQEPPELYKAIVDVLNRLARENGLEGQHAPWPEFLPGQLFLSELLTSQDPQAKAVTSDRYLAEVDKIMLGQERDISLTLNPAVNKWLNGENGWLERLDWKNYAMRPVVGLVDNPFTAQQLPLVIDLPRGHVAIFGASGWGKTTFIRSLVVSLAATHSPDHLHVYVLDLGGRNLGVLKNLPHVGAVISPDEEGYEERVEQLLREVEVFIDERKDILGTAGLADLYTYNAAHPAEPIPAILVAIDNFIEFKETFGSESDNVETVMDKFVGLARQAKPYGIHFVISANQLNVLSNQLYSLFTERMTLRLADRTEYRAIVGGHVADIGEVAGRGFMKIGPQPLSFQVAQPIDLQSEREEPANETRELEHFAQSMKDLMVSSGRTYKEPVRVDALPKGVLYKQMLAQQWQLPLDETFLTLLKKQMAQNWQDSLDKDLADWLKVTIGVISGNRPRPMHFEAKRDGVHGLIAGGTGSGKSELMMTLIVGLALNYDPSILNFVLVDYKGGGAFQPFKDLPHCVDIITNLNKSAVRRMFTAINAEMQRRQKLNVDTRTSNIVEYRAKGFHLTHEPYPHLFIIIDEYAEMITDSPEFKDELESITRLGRAQGVNLLLASQRPVGVTDQMRANIKFRICLRVEGVDTSREMLRRSDAAFLPSGMPGRGYLQIGNENIELTQIAYTGEDYPYAPEREGGEKPKFYDMIIQLTQELLQKERPRTPWPPFLSTALTLADPLVQAYLDEEDELRMTLGQYERATCLNPFVQDWFAGKVGWHGMNWNKTAMRAIIGVVDDPYNARQLPLVVDVTKGHVVLFGASGWGKTTFMRTLIVSLAATHTPDEFHAHVMDLGGRNLEILRALPHVGTVIMPDERGYEERVEQLLRELNDMVDERKRLFSEAGVSTLYEYNGRAEQIKPAILVIVDNFTEFIETFGAGASKKADEDNLLDALVLLVRQAKAYGLHFVISVDRLNVLSSKLYSLFTERLTLRLSDSGDYNGIVGGRVSEIGEIAGRGYVKVGRQPLEFQVAIPVGEFDEQGQLQSEMQEIRRLGRHMNELGQSAWSGQEPLRIDALPKTSSYRQVLTEILGLDQTKNFLEELKAATGEKWIRTDSAEEADWLEGVLGIMSGNRPRTIHFEAKKDGVHGMIAGGTGSGKSELLMTMIIGLALNYSPDILNFVLVDYKGGGAFQPFQKLPHCVDIVTNLNKAAVARMFTAINAEIRRRQGLNAETGTKDIVEYRRKGFHIRENEKFRGLYPHLFIIIDEYAEMIDDNPEYRLELESITRVGRAQGVNLILASQRPKGVSDQMRANIKLRLCLRVEQIDTSRELLRRPDAALLPNGLPGRGYIQAGNENLELVQMSYTGETQPDDRERPVLWPGRPQTESEQDSEDVPKLYDAVVMLTSELVNGQMAPKPWPGFLPDNFSLQSTMYDAQHNRTFTLTTAVTDWLNGDTKALWPGVDWRHEALRPVVGLVDDPAEARQTPLEFDLSRNLVVFGDSGMGKTSLVRTVLTSLAATHSPDELHIYVLDLGGRNFRSLEDLPHVGRVIYTDEEAYEERLHRLLNKLSRMIGERQQHLSNADANNLYEYNESHLEEPLPAVVVVIDNFAELKENYEALVDATLIPLVRRSSSVGISFIVTGNVPNNLPSKLYNLFGERITFRQTNLDYYMDIVGRGAIEIDEIPGRGYIRAGRRPLLCHMALPLGIFGEADGRDTLSEADELRLMARHMHEQLATAKVAGRTEPDPINILSELVSLPQMLAEVNSGGSPRIQAVLGQSSSLEPALFNLKRMGPHFVVVGPPLSGKTTTLYNWVLSLSERYAPEQAKLVLIDMQRKFAEYGGRHKLDELPHVLMSISEVEQMERLLTNLKAECEVLAGQDTNHELFIIIDNYDDFSEEIERMRDLPRDLAGLARRYGGDGLHFIIAGALDSGISELRRRVQSANYGIGLRTGQALDTLRVSRRPAALRDKELSVGRGFIVKSGQPTMIQVASPYEDMGVTITGGESEDEEEKVAQALDIWVEKIQAKYPEQHAVWAQPLPEEEAQADGSGGDSETSPAIDLLRRILHKQGDGDKDDIAGWDDTAVLMKFIKDALEKETGLDPTVLFGTNPEEIIEAAQDYFPEISGNGADSEEAKEKQKA
jgi:DNA segregation ATPase FtsK/SpoIIIE-like protein